MPRFVILEHDWPHLHWDLMLETGDVLRTWRLASRPEIGSTVNAKPLPDHRKLYLDYEGPLSGQRGRVVRWDSGIFDEFDEQSTPDGHITFRLHGERLRGFAEMRQDETGQWRFYLASTLPDTGTTGMF